MKRKFINKKGLIVGSIGILVYLLTITFLIPLGTKEVVYGYLITPIILFLLYTFTVSLENGYIKFLSPSMVMNSYDNSIDNFFRSEFSKIIGSIILPVICFFPLLIFYVLFAWIYYLYKK